MRSIFLRNIAPWLSLSLMVLILSTCSKNEKETRFPIKQFDGSRQSIQNLISPELLNTMENLGLAIHPGNLPPIINGQYLASELRLSASNIATDIPNTPYADTYFTFKKQNRRLLSVDLSYITDNGSEFSHENETLLSGNGSYFTAFGKQIVVEYEGAADMILIVSGKWTDNGIEEFQFALFMRDNHGISGFIENSHGRLFYDSDNLAQKQ